MSDRSLVLVRHGESTWNNENKFSGWRDVPLSDRGIEQARYAGQLLREDRLDFDIAFTSTLKRAIKTLWIMLEEMDQMWVPEHKDYRLNERHYGKLQGLSKSQQAHEYGEEQVRKWRRGWDVRPPLIEDEHEAEFPAHQRQYAHVPAAKIPRGESLADTVQRVIPYWEKVIRPHLIKGSNVLVVAHGNSLRALRKVIENISDADIPNVELPTGMPFVYRLNRSLKAVSKGFRGSSEEVKRAIAEVVNQGRAK
jgi:2,3-bisphosphoglycerate-dependent phosphoglycerate mutase